MGRSVVLLVGGGVSDVASSVLLNPLAGFTLGLGEQYQKASATFLKLLLKWDCHIDTWLEMQRLEKWLRAWALK